MCASVASRPSIVGTFGCNAKDDDAVFVVASSLSKTSILYNILLLSNFVVVVVVVVSASFTRVDTKRTRNTRRKKERVQERKGEKLSGALKCEHLLLYNDDEL